MNKKILGIFLCTFMIGAAIFPAAGMINEKSIQTSKVYNDLASMKFVPGEIIVKLKKDVSISSSLISNLNKENQVHDYEKVFSNAEGTILDNIYLLNVPINSDIPLTVMEYLSCPDVEYAESNQIGEYYGIPNDENFSKQWYLHNTGQVFLNHNGRNYSGNPDADIDATEAWDIEKGNPDVVIAILDSGIDYTHPDLIDNIWNNIDEIPDNGIDDDNNGYIDDIMGWDFYNNTNDPEDDLGHGTMCAGIAAAVSDNEIGVAGVCQNCKIMPIKAGIPSVLNVIKAIRYATDNGADIISMSFGMRRRSFLVKNTIKYAYNKGVLLCASAGNSNRFIKPFPAGYDNVIAVGATDKDDNRAYFSNFGKWVDIAAPGHLIFTTFPTYHVRMFDYDMSPSPNITQNYSWGGGTSASSPIVAGVAALLLSKDPSLTPAEIKALLCGNVDPYNSEKYIGTGRVNAQKALAALESGIKIEIKGGLGVKAVITNTKTKNVTDVEWEINVRGGRLKLINKNFNGTVDLKAGESKTVSTGLIFGLGPIVISARADDVGKAVKGRQLLILSRVK
jgi:subtilisin family serine protease